MNYEKFCEGTLGGCALASPLPFLDQNGGRCPPHARNIRYITLQAQNRGFTRLSRRALLLYLDALQNAFNGPCIASHNAGP